jgi:hypothetical protein
VDVIFRVGDDARVEVEVGVRAAVDVSVGMIVCPEHPEAKNKSHKSPR